MAAVTISSALGAPQNKICHGWKSRNSEKLCKFHKVPQEGPGFEPIICQVPESVLSHQAIQRYEASGILPRMSALTMKRGGFEGCLFLSLLASQVNDLSKNLTQEKSREGWQFLPCWFVESQVIMFVKGPHRRCSAKVAVMVILPMAICPWWCSWLHMTARSAQPKKHPLPTVSLAFTFW